MSFSSLVFLSVQRNTDQADDAEVEISRCSRGQYFGELALVTNKPRAASAYAVGDVKCLGEINALRPLLSSQSSQCSLLTLKVEIPVKRSAVTVRVCVLLRVSAVIDAQTFERLLGPCKEMMKSHISRYEEQLIALFGSSMEAKIQ